jgi:hypothetical protein
VSSFDASATLFRIHEALDVAEVDLDSPGERLP